jgi:hypothetical protein
MTAARGEVDHVDVWLGFWLAWPPGLGRAGQKEEAGEVVGRVHGGGDEQGVVECSHAAQSRSRPPARIP